MADSKPTSEKRVRRGNLLRLTAARTATGETNLVHHQEGTFLQDTMYYILNMLFSFIVLCFGSTVPRVVRILCVFVLLVAKIVSRMSMLIGCVCMIYCGLHVIHTMGEISYTRKLLLCTHFHDYNARQYRLRCLMNLLCCDFWIHLVGLFVADQLIRASSSIRDRLQLNGLNGSFTGTDGHPSPFVAHVMAILLIEVEYVHAYTRDYLLSIDDDWCVQTYSNFMKRIMVEVPGYELLDDANAIAKYVADWAIELISQINGEKGSYTGEDDHDHVPAYLIDLSHFDYDYNPADDESDELFSIWSDEPIQVFESVYEDDDSSSFLDDYNPLNDEPNELFSIWSDEDDDVSSFHSLDEFISPQSVLFTGIIETDPYLRANGEDYWFYDPTFSFSHFNTDFVVSTELNGANGEYTNTDDLPPVGAINSGICVICTVNVVNVYVDSCLHMDHCESCFALDVRNQLLLRPGVPPRCFQCNAAYTVAHFINPDVVYTQAMQDQVQNIAGAAFMPPALPAVPPANLLPPQIPLIVIPNAPIRLLPRLAADPIIPVQPLEYHVEREELPYRVHIMHEDPYVDVQTATVVQPNARSVIGVPPDGMPLSHDPVLPASDATNASQYYVIYAYHMTEKEVLRAIYDVPIAFDCIFIYYPQFVIPTSFLLNCAQRRLGLTEYRMLAPKQRKSAAYHHNRVVRPVVGTTQVGNHTIRTLIDDITTTRERNGDVVYVHDARGPHVLEKRPTTSLCYANQLYNRVFGSALTCAGNEATVTFEDPHERFDENPEYLSVRVHTDHLRAFDLDTPETERPLMTPLFQSIVEGIAMFVVASAILFGNFVWWLLAVSARELLTRLTILVTVCYILLIFLIWWPFWIWTLLLVALLSWVCWFCYTNVLHDTPTLLDLAYLRDSIEARPLGLAAHAAQFTQRRWLSVLSLLGLSPLDCEVDLIRQRRSHLVVLNDMFAPHSCYCPYGVTTHVLCPPWYTLWRLTLNPFSWIQYITGSYAFRDSAVRLFQDGLYTRVTTLCSLKLRAGINVLIVPPGTDMRNFLGALPESLVDCIDAQYGAQHAILSGFLKKPLDFDSVFALRAYYASRAQAVFSEVVAKMTVRSFNSVEGPHDLYCDLSTTGVYTTDLIPITSLQRVIATNALAPSTKLSINTNSMILTAAIDDEREGITLVHSGDTVEAIRRYIAVQSTIYKK
jgi:hypothetical protein